MTRVGVEIMEIVGIMERAELTRNQIHATVA
jgi:hypothetical protein